MEAYMKKLTALFIMLVIGILAGCNTMPGLGKDIERGGEKLQDSAQDAKQRMQGAWRIATPGVLK